MASASSPLPAWHGKWLSSSANPGDSVTLVAYDDSGEAVEFIVSRSVLVGSSEWFATALSGDWSETSAQGRETSKSATHQVNLNGSTTTGKTGRSAGSHQSKHPGGTAIVTLQDGPQAVHDLLCYLHPSTKVRLQPDTVEPLLHLAEMTGLRLLVEQCGDYLRRKAPWDPAGVLRLAERYNLPRLYATAVRVLLYNYEQLDEEYGDKLSAGILQQLRHRHRAFLQEAAIIAARNVVGREKNRCQCCGHLLRCKNSMVLNVLRAALTTKPGRTQDLSVAVNHPPSCDGGMKKLMELQNGLSMEGGTAAAACLDDAGAPSEMQDLLLWAARKVDAEVGVLTVARWLELLQRRNVGGRTQLDS